MPEEKHVKNFLENFPEGKASTGKPRR